MLRGLLGRQIHSKKLHCKLLGAVYLQQKKLQHREINKRDSALSGSGRHTAWSSAK
jgi:hypothetical protein